MFWEQIKEYADNCMGFVYNDLGCKKESVLKVILYLKRNILSKIQLSQLQDLYYKRLIKRLSFRMRH